MFSKKKKTIGSIFTDHYNKIISIAEKSPISQNAEFEVVPAMYVVMDYAAASAEKDRKGIMDAILQEINVLDQSTFMEIFDRRCVLYGEIIRGKKLRCEWFMGDRDVFNNNAISKCTALLGDILYNPDCADDYDTAPILISGLSEAMTFSVTVMNPIRNELMDLFTETYDL